MSGEGDRLAVERWWVGGGDGEGEGERGELDGRVGWEMKVARERLARNGAARERPLSRHGLVPVARLHGDAQSGPAAAREGPVGE